jgi:RNA polymerase sigma factor (sigma-70 family)
MPRLKSTLNKTSQKKLTDFYKKIRTEINASKVNTFIDAFSDIVLKDVRGIKEGNEKRIVDLYIQYGEIISDYPDNVLEGIQKISENVRRHLAGKYTNKTHDDIIDIYFNDVRREYILCPSNASNDLDFLPENRDTFIRNNLKLVVSIAKKFRNFGLPFEDLIQAGNYGLLIAFERFDAERNTLRGKVIKAINESPYNYFSKEDALSLLSEKFTYDNMLSKTEKKIPEDGFSTKEEFIKWSKVHVKTAIFASVAYRWIESYIKQELDKYRSTIRFPKSKKDDPENNPQNKPGNYVISLDSINPYTDDNYNDNLLEEVTQEEFIIEDERIVNEERNEYFTSVLERAFAGLNNMDMRILKRRYGIGFPNELSVNEIAEAEGLSISDVKQSINRSINYIYKNMSDETKENIIELFS